jgi:hypothetical protein
VQRSHQGKKNRTNNFQLQCSSKRFWQKSSNNYWEPNHDIICPWIEPLTPTWLNDPGSSKAIIMTQWSRITQAMILCLMCQQEVSEA